MKPPPTEEKNYPLVEYQSQPQPRRQEPQEEKQRSRISSSLGRIREKVQGLLGNITKANERPVINDTQIEERKSPMMSERSIKDMISTATKGVSNLEQFAQNILKSKKSIETMQNLPSAARTRKLISLGSRRIIRDRQESRPMIEQRQALKKIELKKKQVKGEMNRKRKQPE